MTPAPALRALLHDIVDYAGLFPPAQLGMEAAVGGYASFLAGPDAWMLGAFVVPAARLEELERAAAPHLARAGSGYARRWRVSALVGGDVEGDARRVAAFQARVAGAGGGAVVEQLEGKAATVGDVDRPAAAAAGSLGGAATLYVELPVGPGDPRPIVDAVGRAGARAKVRTGGVTADAFPPPAALARFVAACVDAGVPFKATAGLHHPVRARYPLTYERDAERGDMYGFMNVFLAAALLGERVIGEKDAVRLLEERDPAAFTVADDAIAWRGHALTAGDLARARQHVATSFGSCSFVEPVEDLRSLGLL
ncbi:MAG TPA: hypothetical protein VFJ74_12360 [Gemmatimonadaceae bacterium]|nr:hypothetical protein [Gemmatimonadaceae bacterium]